MATTCSLSVRFSAAEAVTVVRDTVLALQWAELDEALEAVSARVVQSGRLFDVEATSSGLTMHLRPFAELALREVTRVACGDLDGATKTKRIGQVLNLAGY